MAVSPGGLRALRMLAESHFGCTQSVLLAHGLKHEILTEIVDKGLAKATPGTVRIGPLSADDQGDLADDHRRRTQGARRHVARGAVAAGGAGVLDTVQGGGKRRQVISRARNDRMFPTLTLVSLAT